MGTYSNNVLRRVVHQSQSTPNFCLNPSKRVENFLDCDVVVFVLAMQSAEYVKAGQLHVLPSQLFDQLGNVAVILKQEGRRLPPAVIHIQPSKSAAKGGKARAVKLSKQGRNAVLARWAKKKKR